MWILTGKLQALLLQLQKLQQPLAEHGVASFQACEDIFERIWVVDVQDARVFRQFLGHRERDGGIGMVGAEQREENDGIRECGQCDNVVKPQSFMTAKVSKGVQHTPANLTPRPKLHGIILCLSGLAF